MFTRLRLAWRALFGSAAATAGPVESCARCAELARERDYWRSREERTTEALLMREAGVAGAVVPFQKRHNPVGAAVAALGKESYDPRMILPAPHQQSPEGASRGR